ncbi:magnesium/cobalt transporter CorA [Oceanobacillus halophilus]|uniref:Magnesium transport protein CorA n=1 Tax=Oceanobacillus halophilus TaxID=930130 RepID=A0A495A879_9BACI|nr:magnesium/cobalt transporter CorA [Oceanobacillus halophilus]RKQ35853.1 magnesium and cobalt transport protein CorA [Oceanobacillus halophilus]
MIQIIAITSENEKVLLRNIDQFQSDQYKWWWIDFNKPTDEEINKLDTVLNFHPLAIEDCIHAKQRPKLDYYDDFSLIVNHTVGTERYNQHEIDFFMGENYIVTFHLQDLTEVNQVWNNMIKREKMDDWDEFRVLYEVFDKVVDNFFPIIYQLEEQINEVEENPENKAMNLLLDRLFDLRHELLRLRHTINPIRDLLYRMINSHHLQGIQKHREYFADIYDHLLKLSEMVDSNREITNDIRDNFISLNSYQQNKVIQILTVITSIFAPLTFIAGIYGMNFVHMPELTWHYGYFAVLGVMLLVTILMFLWFRQKGWF